MSSEIFVRLRSEQVELEDVVIERRTFSRMASSRVSSPSVFGALYPTTDNEYMKDISMRCRGTRGPTSQIACDNHCKPAMKRRDRDDGINGSLGGQGVDGSSVTTLIVCTKNCGLRLRLM